MTDPLIIVERDNNPVCPGQYYVNFIDDLPKESTRCTKILIRIRKGKHMLWVKMNTLCNHPNKLFQSCDSYYSGMFSKEMVECIRRSKVVKSVYHYPDDLATRYKNEPNEEGMAPLILAKEGSAVRPGRFIVTLKPYHGVETRGRSLEMIPDEKLMDALERHRIWIVGRVNAEDTWWNLCFFDYELRSMPFSYDGYFSRELLRDIRRRPEVQEVRQNTNPIIVYRFC